MTRIDNGLRSAVLVEHIPNQIFHLVVGNDDRGMVLFVCEQAPLLTLKSHHLPTRCPICSTKNPLEPNREMHVQNRVRNPKEDF